MHWLTVGELLVNNNRLANVWVEVSVESDSLPLLPDYS